MSAIKAAMATAAVHEAIKRIPPGFNKTFFSKNDLWHYHAVHDNKLCDDCAAWNEVGYFAGNKVMLAFPYCLVVDENTIYVRVHPYCRCYLTRVIEEEGFLLVYPTLNG